MGTRGDDLWTAWKQTQASFRFTAARISRSQCSCTVAVPVSARLQQYRADTLRQPKPFSVKTQVSLQLCASIQAPRVAPCHLVKNGFLFPKIIGCGMFEELAGFDKYASMFPGNHLHGFEQVVNCIKLPPAFLEHFLTEAA